MKAASTPVQHRLSERVFHCRSGAYVQGLPDGGLMAHSSRANAASASKLPRV